MAGESQEHSADEVLPQTWASRIRALIDWSRVDRDQWDKWLQQRVQERGEAAQRKSPAGMQRSGSHARVAEDTALPNCEGSLQGTSFRLRTF